MFSHSFRPDQVFHNQGNNRVQDHLQQDALVRERILDLLFEYNEYIVYPYCLRVFSVHE